ncbi:MAG TPA: oligosaccharide flippase family protein [Candidatus Marinimicrobia bacterium]|nr:oligosaccharide flippase family protein [Candidatus Neomarinimicrobiota bacterium]MDP6260966.1 oligosaccharide flippase family protein [Candidatus Neomarinimicrobiota bacterium]MDP7126839.1 oligosaccharide flippase family protein [Candidatus Neomarinimicrobiota bacterium]MDP7526175.1 oligosaccharide flippase family protein [Candidatus Neomarinimicrobiota bacterium]HJL79227.1 oligosaccharide flippase family protein [Candidatus Neomarinimicrobiota bacterium]
MLNELKKILNLNTEFSRNVFTLVTGTTIAQIIPIAISPILTRIYTPEDFGVLALFLSVSMLVGAIASARYEQAIILPEKDEDALNLIVLSLSFLVVICCMILMVILLFYGRIVILLNNDAISVWLYFVPLMIFLLGSFNIINVYATRQKQYKMIAKANVYKSLVLATIQIILGVVKSGVSGLISGQIFSTITSTMTLVKNTVNLRKIFQVVTLEKIRSLAKRYIRFPKYSLWAIMSNALTQNVVNVSVSSFFSITTLGFYSFANKIIAMPINLIGTSVGQVFYQQALREQQETGRSVKTFKAVVSKLVMLSFVIFIPLYFVVEDIFAFVFGDKWKIAGQFTKILIPFIMMKFIVSPLSTINNIFDKQIASLIWQIGLLIITLTVLVWTKVFHVDFQTFISFYAKIVSVYYLMMLPVLYNHSRGKNWFGSSKN